MQKITSFTVDHRTIVPGFYLSRVDGDVTTYDLRTRRPNCGDYMDHSTMHTAEHMLATYLRNGELAADILYFGPMGCQTGFYLLVRNADPERTMTALRRALRQVVEHRGEVFGDSPVECGNYRTLDLKAAQVECARYLQALEGWTPEKLAYPKGEDK